MPVATSGSIMLFILCHLFPVALSYKVPANFVWRDDDAAIAQTPSPTNHPPPAPLLNLPTPAPTTFVATGGGKYDHDDDAGDDDRDMKKVFMQKPAAFSLELRPDPRNTTLYRVVVSNSLPLLAFSFHAEYGNYGVPAKVVIAKRRKHGLAELLKWKVRAGLKGSVQGTGHYYQFIPAGNRHTLLSFVAVEKMPGLSICLTKIEFRDKYGRKVEVHSPVCETNAEAPGAITSKRSDGLAKCKDTCCQLYIQGALFSNTSVFPAGAFENPASHCLDSMVTSPFLTNGDPCLYHGSRYSGVSLLMSRMCGCFRGCTRNPKKLPTRHPTAVSELSPLVPGYKPHKCTTSFPQVDGLKVKTLTCPGPPCAQARMATMNDQATVQYTVWPYDPINMEKVGKPFFTTWNTWKTYGNAVKIRLNTGSFKPKSLYLSNGLMLGLQGVCEKETRSIIVPAYLAYGQKFHIPFSYLYYEALVEHIRHVPTFAPTFAPTQAPSYAFFDEPDECDLCDKTAAPTPVATNAMPKDLAVHFSKPRLRHKQQKKAIPTPAPTQFALDPLSRKSCTQMLGALCGDVLHDRPRCLKCAETNSLNLFRARCNVPYVAFLCKRG